MKINFFRGKIGSDKLISAYWFFVIILIAGGVFAMVYLFYGAPYDIREVESEILSDKVSDCISFQGKLNGNLFNETGTFDSDFENNFFEECSLNFYAESENGWDREIQYFSEIFFYSVSDTNNSIFEIKNGNTNFVPDCFIENKKGKSYEHLVQCSEKKFYSVDDSGKQYLVYVLVGVAKGEKNVKL